MRLIPVTSSQLACLGYVYAEQTWETHPELGYHEVRHVGTLVAQFQDGSLYAYSEVPMDVFVDVITDADSQGSAFHQKVKKGGYKYRRVSPEEVARL